MIKPTRPATTCGKPVAIIGIGCRFPGGVTNPVEFWQMMQNKTDAICQIPSDRWDNTKFFHPNTKKPGKSYARWGGFLQENVFDFDPLFFGISPREAEGMDPQQRYLLRVAYEALADAGLPLQKLRGSNTGVFVGGFTLDHMLTQLHPENLHLADSSTGTGYTMAILSNRLSHVFDLRGPSLSVDTACSSSLVATHLAVSSIRAGDCDVAIAGGVTIMTRPDNAIAMCNGGFLSKHGRCMAFDERAEGYTRGEGCGVVVLKSLDRAIEDGDYIYSVIRNTGINQDGATKGIAAPNGDSQQALIERVYREAGLTPSDIQVCEAHGTGTQAGDTTECGALDRVMSSWPRAAKLVVGSVKTNIGHLEAAAGIAGLIKASLMVSKGEVLPNIHFETPNSKIPFEQMPIRVPTESESWPAYNGTRRASVNSFGYGGTNAHAVVESVQVEPSNSQTGTHAECAGDLILPITAQDETALRKLAGKYATRIAATRSAAELHDIVYSATERTSFMRHRVCFVGRTRDQLCAHLTQFAEGNSPQESHYDINPTESAPPLVYVFTGMGPQWHGMGQELYAHEPIFREFVDRADDVFRNIAGWSILEEMQKCESTSRMSETVIAQPANFILQAGLFEVYAHLGLRPDAVTGHSVGEVAAAFASGALSLEDALLVSFHRSQLQSTLAGTGGMLAAGIEESDAVALLQDYDAVEIAAINAPDSVTLAGDEHQLEQLATILTRREIFNRALTVEVPYHSAMMDVIQDPLLEALSDLKPRAPTTPIYSTVTSHSASETPLDATYWWSNVRKSVRFADTVSHVAEDLPGALFFEVGPHPVLRTSIKQTLASTEAPVLHASSLNRKAPELLSMRLAIARLFGAGYDVDWPRVNPIAGRYVKLPTYPWTLGTYRRISDRALEELVGNDAHVIFGQRMESPNPTWEVEVNPHLLPYLQDHIVDESVVVPGAAYVEAGLAIARYDREHSAITIQDVAFHRVLIDQESVQTRLQSSIDPDTGTFRIHSRVVGEHDSWKLNASGRIVENTAPRFGKIDVEPTAGRQLDVDRFYRDLESRGLSYGPCFQTVRTLRKPTPTQVIAKLEQTEFEDAFASHYVLHPTLLDGAFQSMLALIDESSDGMKPSRPFVPVAIERMDVSGTLPTVLFSSAVLTSATDTAIVGDITLFDDQNNILATLTGVRCQALSGETSADPLDNVFHELQWLPAQSGPLGEAGGRSWLLVGDATLTAVCERTLETRESDGPLLTALESTQEASAWIRRNSHLTDIVFLNGFDPAGGFDGEGVVDFMADLTELVRSLRASQPDQPLRLHTITSQAQIVVNGDCNTNLIGSTLNAFGLVVENELPNIRCHFSDVSDFEALEEHLPEILLATDAARERSFRGGQCYQQVLAPTTLDPVEPPAVTVDLHDQCVAIRLQEDGNVGSLRLQEVELTDPLDHEVQIKVHASSLNFKDLLKVYAQIAESVVEDTYCGTTLGLEASGVVTKVGKSVSHLSVGDAVIGVMPDSFRSYANVRADYVIAKPASLSQLEAPTLISYMTAWYGLISKAELGVGERVLIHNATGGVGYVALQVARWRGAEIFATAGTHEKREHLRSLGISHVYDSRTLAFAKQIKNDTQGRGVDVILNAMAGEALAQSFELLAPFGRFVEIGKKNIADNRPLPMRAFQNNLTFAAIDIDRMLFGRTDVVTRLLAEVTSAFEMGCFQPVPVKVFPAGEVVEAFQYMARAKHMGKVVLRFDGVQGDVTPAATTNARIRRNGSYLVTGGTRGFGLEIAKWLAAQGAGRLVLVSRSGRTPEAESAMEELTANGTEVEIRAIDVSSEEQVQQLVASFDDWAYPLMGVFHAAVVLEDAFINQLDRTSLEKVLRPKLLAGRYLHRATLERPLEIFFCFSSISALVGNTGQTSYVLANAYLDALCQYRRSMGLAATSLNWGAISEVGILSRKTDVAGLFQKLGLESISPAEACEVLDRVLSHDVTQLGAFRIDWAKVASANPLVADPSTRFAGMFRDGGIGIGDELLGIRDQLIAECPPDAELEAHVLDVVLARISDLLKIPSNQLEAKTSISNMGVDSLVAVELGISLRKSVGVDFTAVQLLSGPSPQGMRDQIMRALVGSV